MTAKSSPVKTKMDSTAWHCALCETDFLITDDVWNEIWFRIAEPVGFRVTRRLSDPIWKHVVDRLVLEDMVT